MRVLLIWEAIGDQSSFYVIDDPADADVMALEAAHGQIIGSVGDKGTAIKISDMLSEKDEWCETPGASHNCKWKDLWIKEEDLPNSGPFDRVFVSGFCA